MGIPNARWLFVGVDANVTGGAVTSVSHVSGFNLSWANDGSVTWRGSWGTYSPTAGTFANTSKSTVDSTGTVTVWVQLKVYYVVWDPQYPNDPSKWQYFWKYAQDQQTVTLTSPPKRQSNAGAGGVKVAVTDLSSDTGWSGITEIPVSVEVEVPEGTQIDNVVVTASVQTAADYMTQPYSDPNNPSDFSMTWTQLTGNPSWGWSGTSGNLGSITTNKVTNLLNDIGSVPADDMAVVTAQVDYDYQGQHQTLQVSYNVSIWGG